MNNGGAVSGENTKNSLLVCTIAAFGWIVIWFRPSL